MSLERWGSLSVDDHLDPGALAANVLLYDRLVLPVMTSQPDQKELEYWKGYGWTPDLQAERLEQLGDLAVRRPWTAERRATFRARWEQLKAEQFDSSQVFGRYLTRLVLAQEQVLERPAGVTGVRVIAAYNSAAALQRDFQVAPVGEAQAATAFLVTRKLALPDLADPEEALRLAVELSRDQEFRKRRADLFSWQAKMQAEGWTPETVAENLSSLAESYNDAVRRAERKVVYKFAFAVSGIAAGLLAGGPVGGLAAAGSAASAAITLVEFYAFDRSPVVEAGEAECAAMFHDIEAKVGMRLRA